MADLGLVPTTNLKLYITMGKSPSYHKDSIFIILLKIAVTWLEFNKYLLIFWLFFPSQILGDTLTTTSQSEKEPSCKNFPNFLPYASLDIQCFFLSWWKKCFSCCSGCLLQLPWFTVHLIHLRTSLHHSFLSFLNLQTLLHSFPSAYYFVFSE